MEGGLIRPARVQAGDTVAVVSPCSPVVDWWRHRAERGQAYLESLGLNLRDRITRQHTCRLASSLGASTRCRVAGSTIVNHGNGTVQVVDTMCTAPLGSSASTRVAFSRTLSADAVSATAFSDG